MKPIVTLITALRCKSSSAQFYSGYFVSDPQVHSFDHFKIKYEHDQTKLDGDLIIHAFIGNRKCGNNEFTTYMMSLRKIN